MKIWVNEETITVTAGYQLTQLLSDLGYGEKRIAVEMNQEIIPRSQYPEVVLHDDDRIEIVEAIGGG